MHGRATRIFFRTNGGKNLGLGATGKLVNRHQNGGLWIAVTLAITGNYSYYVNFTGGL